MSHMLAGSKACPASPGQVPTGIRTLKHPQCCTEWAWDPSMFLSSIPFLHSRADPLYSVLELREKH